MSTACYISNRAYVRKGLDKTPYELYKGRKPNISHLRIFGSKCYVHNNGKVNLDRKSTRLNSSHSGETRMPTSA